MRSTTLRSSLLTRLLGSLLLVFRACALCLLHFRLLFRRLGLRRWRPQVRTLAALAALAALAFPSFTLSTLTVAVFLVELFCKKRHG